MPLTETVSLTETLADREPEILTVPLTETRGLLVPLTETERVFVSVTEPVAVRVPTVVTDPDILALEDTDALLV